MSIDLLIKPREKDLGGFTVRRILPYAKRRMVGPWIFFDHMGPVDFSAGEGVDVWPHPHINLATVTYLFDGEILHRDSLGSHQAIRPGDINLMMAGRGIVHSERERPEVRHSAHRLHGLQLWLALPEKDEERDPAFYHYPAAVIPTVRIDGVPVRVMMGSAYGATSPVETYAETLYAEATLKTGQGLVAPDAPERAVYVTAGAVRVGDREVAQYHMAVITPGAEGVLRATRDTRLAVIGGETMAQRHIYWNFVSSRQERIEQAKRNWRHGRFPKIPGDAEDFIPLPEEEGE